MLIPGLFTLVGLVVCFTLDIFLLIKGVIYIGVFLGLIALIILNYIIVKALILFMIKKKMNYKVGIVVFLGSLILGGVSIEYCL
jgi:hypothetical protein